MTPEEMKAMEGTEFIYVFTSGRTMRSYVKRVDVEQGKMSCWSFSLTTDCGTRTLEPLSKDEEKEQACCVCKATNIKKCKEKLLEIEKTGKYIAKGTLGLFSGCDF